MAVSPNYVLYLAIGDQVYFATNLPSRPRPSTPSVLPASDSVITVSCHPPERIALSDLERAQ